MKRLLIITQKVDSNDDVLGFFHDWLAEFAKQIEQVEVVCLWEGKHSLPANVRVHSLGKEKGSGKLVQLLRLKYFLLTLRYDAVFAHMNPIYVVLAGWYWRLSGKKTVLFYTHRHVDLKLRIAELFASKVATATKESFQLPSRKVHIVGHGIDTKKFAKSQEKRQPNLMVAVGRVSPIKHQDILIEATALLHKHGMSAKVFIVGVPVYESDVQYELGLKKRIQELGLVGSIEFVGSVPNSRVASYYHRATVSVNLLPTGGLDKVVLESLSAGTPVLTTNKTFTDLGLKGVAVSELAPEHVASALADILKNPPVPDPTQVEQQYSVFAVVSKILKLYE